MKGEGELYVQGREQVCLYPRLHGERLSIASLMINYNEINVWTCNIGKLTWSKYIKENKSQPKKSEVGFYLSPNTKINQLIISSNYNWCFIIYRHRPCFILMPGQTDN